MSKYDQESRSPFADHMICGFCHQDTPTELLYAINRKSKLLKQREVFGALVVCQACIDQIFIPIRRPKAWNLYQKEITINFKKILEEQQNGTK